MKIKFYDTVNDSLLAFAVIIAVKDGKLIFCKHRERDTLEIPGGHREQGESVDAAAERELYEETGALSFDISPLFVYSVTDENGCETFGQLYLAHVYELEPELHSEIESIVITDEMPDKWTYPLIQPQILKEARRRGII